MKLITFLPLLLPGLMIISCSNKSIDSGSHVPDKTEPVSVYKIEGATALSVKDSISGGEFLFPHGGSGDLTVVRLSSKAIPAEPAGYNGVSVNYTGNDSICLSFTRDSQHVNMVKIWDYCSYSFQGGQTADSMWIPVPASDTSNSDDVYRLELPGYKSKKTLEKSSSINDARLVKSYFILYSHAKKTDNEAIKIASLAKIAKLTIQDVIDSMPPSLRDIASVRVISLLPLKGDPGSYSGWSTYYHPWSYFEKAFGIHEPYFVFKVYGGPPKEATPASVAHEVGHYMSHVMLGDDYYGTYMIPQAEGKHDLSDPRPARPMVEEYAHFIDWFKNGKLAEKYDIEEVNNFFRDKRTDPDVEGAQRNHVHPDTYDWPSMEGFGCALLSRMIINKTTILNHMSDQEESIPVIGATIQEMLRLLYTNAMDSVTDLGREIMNWAEAKGGDVRFRIPVVFEKVGWSYNGPFVIKDLNGKYVDNAKIQNIIQVKPGEEYRNTYMITTQDGKASLPRLFPFQSIIRVFYSYNETKSVWNDSADFPLSIDISRPTNKTLDPETLIVGATKPLINSILPLNALPGQFVGITGSGFGEDSTIASVLFNNVEAKKYTTFSNTYIGVYIPQTASSGPVLVKIGKTESNPFMYTMKDSTRISSIAPSSVYTGDTLLIKGKGFGVTGSSVYFGNGTDTVNGNSDPSNTVSWSDTLVRVRVFTYARTGTVWISGATGKSNRYPVVVLLPYSQYGKLSFSSTIQAAFINSENAQSTGSWYFSNYSTAVPIKTHDNDSVIAHYDTTFGTETHACDITCKIDFTKLCLRKLKITASKLTTYTGGTYSNAYDTLYIDSLPMDVNSSTLWNYQITGDTLGKFITTGMHYETTNATTGNVVTWKKTSLLTPASYSSVQVSFVK